MNVKSLTKQLCLSTFAISSLSVFAAAESDDLTLLHQSLDSLTAESSIQAKLVSNYQRQRDNDDKIIETTGAIDILLHHDRSGLSVRYEDATVQKLAQEQQLKAQDEEADTPTINASERFSMLDFTGFLSGAKGLQRFINKANLDSVEKTELGNKPVFKYQFSLPLESLVDSAEVREYVDDFDGSYSLFTDENRVPLESKLEFSGSGTAFLFFSMEMKESLIVSYQKIGDRLVTTDRYVERFQKSPWGKTEMVATTQLRIQNVELAKR